MTALETAQIVSIIVSGIVALGGFLGLGIYFAERARYKAGKKNRKEQAREDAEEERKNENLRKIIREENKPLQDKLNDVDAKTDEIKSDLAKNTKGTVTLLRNDMKKSLDFCKKQGYASASDRANWHELYNTYANLGGNHFREYVDAWKDEFDALPVTPAKRNSRKQSDRQ